MSESAGVEGLRQEAFSCLEVGAAMIGMPGDLARAFEPFLRSRIPLGVNLILTEREPLPVAEARAGNPASWDFLFRRYQLPLYVYINELVRHDQASLDRRCASEN